LAAARVRLDFGEQILDAHPARQPLPEVGHVDRRAEVDQHGVRQPLQRTDERRQDARGRSRARVNRNHD